MEWSGRRGEEWRGFKIGPLGGFTQWNKTLVASVNEADIEEQQKQQKGDLC